MLARLKEMESCIKEMEAQSASNRVEMCGMAESLGAALRQVSCKEGRSCGLTVERASTVRRGRLSKCFSPYIHIPHHPLPPTHAAARECTQGAR